MVLSTPFHERLAPLNQTRLWSHWSGLPLRLKVPDVRQVRVLRGPQRGGPDRHLAHVQVPLRGREPASSSAACWPATSVPAVMDGRSTRLAATTAAAWSKTAWSSGSRRRLHPHLCRAQPRLLPRLSATTRWRSPTSPPTTARSRAGPEVAGDPGLTGPAGRRDSASPAHPGARSAACRDVSADRVHRRSRLRDLGGRRRRRARCGMRSPRPAPGAACCRS